MYQTVLTYVPISSITNLPPSYLHLEFFLNFKYSVYLMFLTVWFTLLFPLCVYTYAEATYASST
jgi:hypothetical protein